MLNALRAAMSNLPESNLRCVCFPMDQEWIKYRDGSVGVAGRNLRLNGPVPSYSSGKTN